MSLDGRLRWGRSSDCWDRGRPARNEREARKWIRDFTSKSYAPPARGGRDARGPSKPLDPIQKAMRRNFISFQNRGLILV